MTATNVLRELNSLGGQKAKLRREGASPAELAAIENEITLARAEFKVFTALASVPSDDRQLIINSVTAQLGL